ncbi:MAG: glyoxalase [Gammaproteobacteria bacterium]|nr:glyoxalase [Gammaproteobacteria bacterium]
MQLGQLDHVNLRTTRLDILVDWYTRVLGMRPGVRPNFPFPGAWLYAGDAAAVHIVGIDGTPGVGSEAELRLEHFAFSATGRRAFEARLEANGEKYHRTDIADFNIIQINVWDPDGNHIHVDFPADE